jgi:hypothetical protein
MAKLIFKYTDSEYIDGLREASEIEFTVPDDMDIHEFKIMCVRLASSLGYQQETIDKGFGNLVYGDESKDGLRQLLNEINNKKID